MFIKTPIVHFRELPDSLLTTELLARFEEAGAIMELDLREKTLQNLLAQLPVENKILLGWLINHFDIVTMHVRNHITTRITNLNFIEIDCLLKLFFVH